MTAERGQGRAFEGVPTHPRDRLRSSFTSGGAPLPMAGGRRTSVTAPSSLMKIVWHGRWTILICIIAALVAGFVYLQTATPIYTSASKLYLVHGSLPVTRTYQPGVPLHTDRYLQTQAERLQSRPILETVLAEPAVLRMRTFSGEDTPIAYLHRNLRVYVGRRDDIITVSLDSPDAVEAAQLVNRVVMAYLASLADEQKTSAEQVLTILQEDLARASEELTEKRDARDAYLTHEMPAAMGSEQGGGAIEALVSIQADLSRAQTRCVEARLFYEGVQALANSPSTLMLYFQSRGVGGSDTMIAAQKAPLHARLTEMELQLSELRKDFTADNPRITALEQETGELEAKLAEVDRLFVEAVLAAAEREYAEAQAAEADLSARLEEQRKSVTQVSAELTRYDRLRSEVTQAMEYYQSVEQQIKDIQRIVHEDVGQLKMEVLERAVVAEVPTAPRRSKVMAMALMLGLLCGGALSVVRDTMTQTLRTAEEISSLLDLPLLGVVPAMSRRERVQVRGQKVHVHSDSPEAEAFRTVRTAVFFGAAREQAKTVLVTSPAAGDGKSTLASNLAIAMAQAGEKTILVDADFRRPMQQVLFDVDHEKEGLSAVISGQIKLREAIRQTPVKGLSLLPCGPDVSNPAEVLNSAMFAKLVQCLAGTYDRVLIDAPPVTVVTDAQILSARCDVTVLVLRADRSTRKTSMRAVDVLESVGARVLGIVVNDVRGSGNRYGYYGGHNGSKTRAAKENGSDLTSLGRRGRQLAGDVTVGGGQS